MSVATGAPPASTRVAPTTNCPMTHGGVGVLDKAQPAIAYGLINVTSGCAETVTRANGVSGVACPACEQTTVAPRWRTGAGISHHRQRAEVHIGCRTGHVDDGALAI